MAELKDRPKEYYIPDNFIEEGRIFQGRVRVRNLIEAAVLTAAAAVPALLVIRAFPQMGMRTKIALFVFMCAPAAVLGIIGFNGDGLFEAAAYAAGWLRDSRSMIYNPKPRLLTTDPVDEKILEQSRMDRLIEQARTGQRRRAGRRTEEEFAGGTGIEFAEEVYVDRYTGGRDGVKNRTKKPLREKGREKHDYTHAYSEKTLRNENRAEKQKTELNPAMKTERDAGELEVDLF